MVDLKGNHAWYWCIGAHISGRERGEHENMQEIWPKLISVDSGCNLLSLSSLITPLIACRHRDTGQYSITLYKACRLRLKISII